MKRKKDVPVYISKPGKELIGALMRVMFERTSQVEVTVKGTRVNFAFDHPELVPKIEVLLAESDSVELH